MKAARAHQLYLPNNPIHKGALDAVRAAFPAIWSHGDDLVLSFTETDIKWFDHVVLHEPSKSSDSLPWLFFKDGVRELRLMRGFEESELVALLDKFKEQGITPVAHGGQPWQDATIFDAVVLSFGNDFYKKAFIDLDPETLGSAQMKEAFDRMTKLRSYVDDNFSGRDWNLASAMVIEGKAGLQFMGDWAKGEFIKAGKKPGGDFVCMRFPGTQGSVTFNSDQFAMFAVSEEQVPAQMQMASAIENPTFQSAFNVVKGSAPARTDVPNTDFDDCGKKAMADLADADKNGRLFGSMAHGHANPAAVKNAIYDVVTRQFNGELSSEDAVKELVAAVEGAK